MQDCWTTELWSTLLLQLHCISTMAAYFRPSGLSSCSSAGYTLVPTDDLVIWDSPLEAVFREIWLQAASGRFSFTGDCVDRWDEQTRSVLLMFIPRHLVLLLYTGTSQIPA
jgi:hypothetical protein